MMGILFHPDSVNWETGIKLVDILLPQLDPLQIPGKFKILEH